MQRRALPTIVALDISHAFYGCERPIATQAKFYSHWLSSRRFWRELFVWYVTIGCLGYGAWNVQRTEYECWLRATVGLFSWFFFAINFTWFLSPFTSHALVALQLWPFFDSRRKEEKM